MSEWPVSAINRLFRSLLNKLRRLKFAVVIRMHGHKAYCNRMLRKRKLEQKKVFDKNTF